MNILHSPDDAPASTPGDELMSARFEQMVMYHSQMALMMLGAMPHPQSGELTRDLESARLFIDQLEMLEAKTKGNLSKHENDLLQRSLTNLRMAFVEAVEQQEKEPKSEPTNAAPESARTPSPKKDASDDESKKRFSKKY
ncbi:MAG TPA: DUF1844 domain-containing protein [Verrucomicrobiae bacterium]|jgi:hypothetical protein